MASFQTPDPPGIPPVSLSETTDINHTEDLELQEIDQSNNVFPVVNSDITVRNAPTTATDTTSSSKPEVTQPPVHKEGDRSDFHEFKDEYKLCSTIKNLFFVSIDSEIKLNTGISYIYDRTIIMYEIVLT